MYLVWKVDTTPNLLLKYDFSIFFPPWKQMRYFLFDNSLIFAIKFLFCFIFHRAAVYAFAALLSSSKFFSFSALCYNMSVSLSRYYTLMLYQLAPLLLMDF